MMGVLGTLASQPASVWLLWLSAALFGVEPGARSGVIHGQTAAD